MLIVRRRGWVTVYGDEEGSGSGSTEEGGSSTEEGTPTLTSLIEKHGLQDQLNTMFATNRRNLTQKNAEVIQQLEKFKAQESVNAQDKEELETQIEQLKTQHLSTEEIAKHNSEKATKEHSRVLDALTLDAGKWKALYEDQTIERELLDSASQSKAIRPEQIVSILRSDTSVVEVLDSVGKGTGVYKTVVRFNDVNEAGENITIDFSPMEAVNRMKELPKLHGNLFEGTSTGGLGASGNTDGGDGSVKLADITKDRAAFRKYKEQNPDLDLSKIK